MCSKSLLTIKSSNESPKYQKTSFKKMVTNNFPETKEQMVIKMISLSKHKCHENKMDTKILRQSSHSAETEQSRFLNRNLVCQKSMTLAINEKQD